MEATKKETPVAGGPDPGQKQGNDFKKNYTQNAPELSSLFDVIPEELKERRQWIFWIEAPNAKPDKKPLKILVDAKTGKPADSTDPATWASFDEAKKVVEQRGGQKHRAGKNTGTIKGVGFVFSEDDPYTGIDLDHCIDPDGYLLPWADKVVERFNSYTETSISGTGLHILIKGKKPGDKCKKGDVECYSQGRFFAITGDIIGGRDEIHTRREALGWFYSEYLGSKGDIKPKPASPQQTDFNNTVDAQTVLDRAFASKSGDTIKRLFDGDTSTHPSHSEADQALCNHLAFWFGKDPDRMDAVFRQSGLYREKWDEKHFSDGRTYGQATINQAIAKTSDTYKKPTAASKPKKEDPDKIKERAKQILRDRQPPGALDLDSIPDLIRTYVDEICRRTDADKTVVLMAVLCSMSAIIGRRAYIPEGEYFSELYANIWTFVQALSGGFKTTALNKGCRIAWQKEARIQEQITELKNEKGRVCEIEDAKEAKAETKRIDREIRELQAESCILPNRMSGEGLLELLADGQAGMIPASEFGEWLDNLAKNHNQGLKPLFTDLFDVPQQYGYKTKGGGYLIIKRPFISICGMSTGEWIKKNITLSDIGSGFFARFLLFCPPQQRAVPPALPHIQGAFESDAEDELRKRLDSLGDDHRFSISPAAASHFEAVHRAIYAALEQLDEQDQDLLAPYAKRWSPYVLKLAMIFQAAIDPVAKIGIEAVQAGAAVVEYAIKGTVHLFKHELGMSPFQQDCQRVLEFIAKQGGNVYRKKLLTSHSLEGGSKEYDEVLTTLDEQGRISIAPAKQRRYEQIQLAGGKS